MSNIARVALALACACVSVVSAARSGQGNTTAEQRKAVEKAVLETHARIAQAEEELDAEKLFAYIPDFDKGLIVQDGTLFKTRQEALDAVTAGFQGVGRVDRAYEERYVTVLSAEAALLTAKGTSSVTLSDGRALSGPFAASMVFVLRDGQWRLLHGHYSIPNSR
jgi:hypothetical protein